jgi:two-component SAPR family response regulator
VQPARILVLEDDDNLRDVLAEVLRDEGFEVKAVARGEAAVECASQEAFDLIIADIRMEGMGGLEALEQAQKLQPGIGSLIVSGYATEQETARAERLQVGAYLTKPFKMQELLSYVRSQLADRVMDQTADSEEEFVRRALDWSLSALAKVIDDTGALEGSLLTAATAAHSLCQQFHQPAAVCMAARWATIVMGASSLPELPWPTVMATPNRQLPELTEILKTLQATPHGEDLPTPAQTVGMALAAHVGRSESLDPEALGKELEGRFRGDLIEALLAQGQSAVAKAKVPLEVQLGLEKENPQHRTLVSLGRTLERVGDRESARKAYSALSQEGVPSREHLSGLLGLARLALTESKTAEARTLCIKALRLARSHGPTTLAQFGLEAALLLEQAGADEAAEALRAVGQAAANMGLTVKTALIRYALSGLAGEPPAANDLKILLSPVSANELGPYVDWLLPQLLSKADEPARWPAAPVLLQVIADFPRRFLHWFDPARCSAETRLKVGAVLGGAKFLPDDVLGRLESDPEPALRDLVSTVRARQEGGPRTQILRVHSFGPLELISQGELVPETLWKTRKIKFLFAYLASRWGKPISEDHIIEALWPKDNVRNKNNLYWGTTTLRGALRSLNPTFESPLVRVHDTLSLHPDFPRWHDLEEFEKAAAEGQRLDGAGDQEGALTRFRLASRVYRGPFMEGCFHDFALEARERTEKLALDIFLRAAQIGLQRNQDEEAAELAASAVELAPYRQDAQALQMRALIRLNRGTQVIELFHKLEKNLREEYELEPTTELLELYHRARLGYTDA